jgi:hypothetical protein
VRNNDFRVVFADAAIGSALPEKHQVSVLRAVVRIDTLKGRKYFQQCLPTAI